MPTVIDKTRAQFIMTELSLVLKDFAKKHDLVSAPVKLKYSTTDYTARVKFIQKDAVDSGQDPFVVQKLNKAAATYLAQYRLLGLPDLGSRVEVGGRILKIEGMRVKNVVLLEEKTGKRFKMKFIGLRTAKRIPS